MHIDSNKYTIQNTYKQTKMPLRATLSQRMARYVSR